jgi:hypothetical protein
VRAEPSHPTYASFMVRSLVTLLVPQGYTLSIAGSFAVAAYRYGFPVAFNAFGFIAGAVAAYLGLAVVARPSLGGSPVPLPTGFFALLNVVPLAVVPLVAAMVVVVPWAWAGFPLAGLAGAGGYVLLLSCFFRWLPRERWRQR